MAAESAAGEETIKSDIPARLDRLPWSSFHWMIIVGLGTVWILDGLEVTLVGSVAGRMTEQGSGISLDAAQIGTAAAIYVAGAVAGALFFGRLTDKFGRKKLFIITLGVYITATVLTAFSMSPLWFYVCRFFTGAGIGGEYSAINSAIDELIPARVRGRVDLIINGSYWLGAAAAALGSIVLLDTALFAADLGWRLAFGLGGLLGITILIVRRHVPESPRWLSIHGRNEEAEEIVGSIEQRVKEDIDGDLPEPDEEPIEMHQRGEVSLTEVARTAVRDYPKRTILGLSLFVGQAFLYNAITFDLGTLLGEFFQVGAATAPFFIAAYAFSNFLGPVTLGRLFDSVGRKPMIVLTYGLAAAGGIALAVLLPMDGFTKWWFMAVLMFTFFFASSGASSAYLTVSEIFPMETRALAIAVFYSVGTGLGGIVGPLLFGHLINTGDPHKLAIGFYIGAAAMLLGALAELFFGVKAENKSLESVATPLSATDDETGSEGKTPSGDETGEEAKRPEAGPVPVRRRERFRPGRGSAYPGRGFPLTASTPDVAPGPEVESLVAVLESNGELSRRDLYRRSNAARWGPGRFSRALTVALAEGRVIRSGRRRYSAEAQASRGG
jgi:MFS family permease